MKQALALEIMLAGHSVLLTGPAGSGKTHVLNQFIRIAKQQGKHISITATTGLAATHLGGTTIHSWSGLGIHDELPPNFADTVSKGRREIIEKTDVLIIDEISMLHDFRLDMVDEACRLVRKQPDTPFGGIQLIMSGDFFQLPPINRGNSRAGGFVVNAQSYRELDPTVCYLAEQHRQKDNDELTAILDAMRSGDLRRHQAEALLRQVKEVPSDTELTELYTVNIDVDAVNQKRLEILPGDEMIYSRHSTGADNYVDSLQRSVLAPADLRLKKDALVMTVRNSPEKKYVNGSIGRVIEFEAGTDYPVVELRNGKTVTIQPETWELRDGDKKRASITQLPLRLAWAITVHKSQGMTLDAALVDLRRAFVEGMGYVALSRVRTIDQLYLKGINQMAITVSSEARQIDGQLRERSDDDSHVYADLIDNAKKRQAEPPTTKKGGSSWQDKIALMRKTYPNAYRPWQKADDATLKQNFLNGADIAQLSQALGRHEGSIKMRLQKHFGDDILQ